MLVAGLFMIGQRDFKRLLAYSSVEHMGILIFGRGIGAPALFGTLLHVMMNSMTKGVLFLSAGNIHRAYGSKSIDRVHGALHKLPLSGILLLTGFIAIIGSPPFGTFISEFSIINGAFASGHFASAGFFLLFLMIVFVGMGKAILSVVLGKVPADSENGSYRDTFFTTAPVLILAVLVLLLGIYIPSPLNDLITNAVKFLEN
jgi:hydrogenase-4 component F